MAEELENVRTYLKEAHGWYTKKASRFSSGNTSLTLIENFKEVSVRFFFLHSQRLSE
jgi:hypothetical protein